MHVDEVTGLFADPRVVVLTAELDDAAIAELTSGEAEAVARAVPKRKRELATGRALARLALERHGLPRGEIPIGPDRAPVWPASIAGSISHSDTRAIVALGLKDEIGSVGIDLESGPSLARELWASVLVPEEIAALEREDDEPTRLRHALVLFAAKEVLYKAQYPVSRTFMDFHALRVELDSVRAVLTRTSAGPEAVRLAESVSARTAMLGRREFHVPTRQESIDGWWSLTGVGTVLSAVGALFLLLAALSGRGAGRLSSLRE